MIYYLELLLFPKSFIIHETSNGIVNIAEEGL